MGTGNSYSYDANGNMTTRIEGGITYTQSWTPDNRLEKVTWINGGITREIRYLYDGDGNKLVEFKALPSDTSRKVYIRNIEEWSFNGAGTSGISKYFFFGGKRVSMRINEDGPIYHFGSDHLGSVSLAVSGGVVQAQSRFTPFGVERWKSGDVTQYGFTGQREDSYIKLLDFGARWYDPYLNQWIQPDTIIPDPGNPADWNRYAYVRNNPLKYNDPSGHMQACADGDEGGGCGYGTPDYRDLTRWIVDTAEYTANDPVIQLVNYLNSGTPRGSAEWFYKMTKVMIGLKLFQDRVKDGARFDFKDKMKDQLQETIKIGRYWYDYSTPGNLLYGYYGTAAGYPAWVLHAGAGKAQWDDDQRARAKVANGEQPESDSYGFWWCGFDTCDDYFAVEVGIDLYESGEVLTVDKLVAATERLNFLLAGQPAPGPYTPLKKHGMYTPEDFINE